MRIGSFMQRMHAFDKNIEEIASEYQLSPFVIKMDCILSRVIDGAIPAQYFAFQFYKLRLRERRHFVTKRRSNRIERIFNTADEAEKKKVGDKATFNKVFASFVKRDWIYIPDSTEDELKSFLTRNRKVLIKPVGLTQGKGIRLLQEKDYMGRIPDFYQEAIKEDLLLESFITQHHLLNELNPDSVNTVRVCTARDRNGEVHVIGTSLRVGGAGSVVDNLHSDGVQYPVDPVTGIIIRGGVKFTGERNIIFHPSTHHQMLGLKVPNWDQVIDTCKQAGKILPSMRYIGWDVAVTEDGCELIEANYEQGSNGMQQDGIGKYRQIMQYK